MTGPRPNKIEITDEVRARIRDLHAEGFSQTDIAKRFGIGASVISRILRGLR